MTTIDAPPTLHVRRLSGAIGAELRGIDLKQPLAEDTVAEIRQALLDHKVIFFPGQHLTPAEHVAFGAYFGEVTPAHPVIPGIEADSRVFEIDYSESAKLYAAYGDVARRKRETNGLSWHTDVTFVERPPLGSILNAVVIPEAGGDTAWSNQAAAFAALSSSLQAYLETLTAVHDGQDQFAALLEAFGEGVWDDERFTSLAPVEHPVVRTHPETGEKVLFVNPGFTSHIKELSGSESDALLAFLYAHSTKPEFTVRYHWTAGDLGFWDNRVTQHSVVGDFTEHRVIQRITLRGDKPV
ncbi:MAG: Taurine dioxygenase [Actinomycetia bacterium]|nr:Taurine dioxygenase [Actinomycetes bacterium]